MVNVHVHLQRDGDRRCRCKGEHAYIARARTDKHLGELKCTSCGRFRDWLDGEIAATVLALVELFGRPRVAIVIRTPVAFPLDAPATDNPASITSSKGNDVDQPTHENHDYSTR
jgi:hypothetical protein